mmetsp:Transcript_35583/g.62866  ORF Transcript_35583/g.62866 Transcript_35583/m.62866 type:complete len:736 (+) Transcript_35583:139-2346(+)
MMQMTSAGSMALLLLLRNALIGQVVTAVSTSAKTHAKTLSAMSEMLRSLQHREGISAPGDDTKKLVEALEEVVKDFDEEDKIAKAMLQATVTECKGEVKYLDQALAKGQRAAARAADGLKVAKAEEQSMDARLQQIKGEKQDAMTHIEQLEADLKQLREDKGLLTGNKTATLQMLQEALSLSYMQGKQHTKRNRLQAKLRARVSYLEKLGKGLLPAADSNGAPDAASSFVQTSARATHGQRRASENPTALALAADKQEVMSQSSSARKGFDDQEKQLLELIREERKKIETLESQEEEQRVTLVEKMTKIQEIQIELDGSEQAIERDTLFLKVIQDWCNYTETGVETQEKDRKKVVTDLKMAKALIMHTDVSVFLTKDIQGFQRSAPTFLQVRSRAASRSKAIDEGTGDASTDAGSLPLGSLVASGGDDAFIQDSSARSGAGSQSYASPSSSGDATVMLQDDPSPFDSVTQMIENLIANLKDQNNQDVNKNQLCLDQLAENRKASKKFQQQIAQAKTEIHLGAGNIQAQNEAVTWLGETITAIQERVTKIKANDEQEIKRVETMQKDHQNADKVMTDAIVILKQLCNLPDSGAASALLQDGRQIDQCGEAAKMLDSSVANLQGFDTSIGTYLTGFKALSAKLLKDAQDAISKAETLKQTATTSVAQLTADRVSRQGDLKAAEAQYQSLLQTKETIEHGCSHSETHEEKQARRQEEIDALKEALKVLEGEAIPAYSR